MSYEFEMDKYGNIREYGGGMGLKAPERRMNDKDRVFLDRVIRALDGDAEYDLRNIVDLQREYGESFQIKLLNGLFNYRDKALAEISKMKSERDFMLKANSELLNKVKALQAENEKLILNVQKKKQKEVEKVETEVMKNAVAQEVLNTDNDINAQIIQLHLSRFSQRKISELLGISTSRVSSVIRNYYTAI